MLEFLSEDLEATGLIKNYKKENLVSPRLGKNFTGDLFFTDGDVYKLFIK